MVLDKKNFTAKTIGLFILFFLLLTQPAGAQIFDCSAQTYLDENECEALVAIYDSTGGDTWGNLNKLWLGAANPCDESLGWFGVTCNTDSPANVTILSLPSNNLTGTLPPEIGDFQYMIELNLSGNGLLTGALPGEIGTLVRLEILNIGVGGFTGNLPSQVGNLSFLQTLDISNNQFEGEIPSSFVNLTALTYFDTTNNTLCLPNDQNVQDWYDDIADTPGLLGPCETPTPTITPTKTKAPNTLTPTPIPLPTNTPTITPTPTITLTPTMLGPFQTLTALAYEDTLTATANWLKTPTPIMTATRYYILVSQTLVPAGEDQQVTQAAAGQDSDSPIPGDEGSGRSPLWWLLLIIPVGLIGAGLYLEIRGRKSKKGDSGGSSNDDEGGFQTFI